MDFDKPSLALSAESSSIYCRFGVCVVRAVVDPMMFVLSFCTLAADTETVAVSLDFARPFGRT